MRMEFTRYGTWFVGALIFVAGCFQDSTPQHSAYLPLDYQSTYHKVRSCRLVTGHDNHYEVVFTNDVAYDPYLTASYPVPVGSVVAAEEHGDPSCGSLVGYKLMVKEKPGYDSANGDWHWQQLDDNQRVLQDGRLTACATCHATTTPPCNDYLCTP
jgi:hypothetical protein